MPSGQRPWPWCVGPTADERRVLRTKLRIPAEDFDAYEVGHPAKLVFALKEFKAMLQFADALKCTIQARFDDGGTPLVFSLTVADVLQARLTVSTHSDAAAPLAPVPAAAGDAPGSGVGLAPDDEPDADDMAAVPVGGGNPVEMDSVHLGGLEKVPPGLAPDPENPVEENALPSVAEVRARLRLKGLPV